MKPHDIVRISDTAPEDWLPHYREYHFEVRNVFERRCVVKMLGGNNPERYIFTEKEHFVPVKENDSDA